MNKIYQSAIATILFTSVALIQTGCGKIADQTSADSNKTEDIISNSNSGDSWQKEMLLKLPNTSVILTDAQMNQIHLSTSTLVAEKVGNYVELQGKVMPSPTGLENVTALAGGTLKKILVKPGDQVRKGQVLCSIANLQVMEWQEQYAQSVKMGAALQKEWERQQDLYASKASSDKQLQAAKSDYESNHAKVLALESKLQLLGVNLNQVKNGNFQPVIQIVSPDAGKIESVDVHTGETVSAEKIIMSISHNQYQQWVLQATPEMAEQIVEGNDVICSFLSLDKKISTKVVSVGSMVGDNRLVSVFLEPKPNLVNAKFGHTIKGVVSMGEQQRIVIADSAVLEKDGGYFCFVESDKKGEFKAYALKVDGKFNGNYMIANPPTSKVVTSGAYWLWMKLNESSEE